MSATEDQLVSQANEDHAKEIAAGERFSFGANWARFLSLLDDERVAEARKSLVTYIGMPDLTGRRFLDIGCGSGLFSLAARQLGAEVVSFDYDPASVACALELKRRYFSGDPRWTIARGSVLDMQFVDSLGSFDIVYSWGVLHHTGAMWRAIENALRPTRTDGVLFISIYADVGMSSRLWRGIKRMYNKLPGGLQVPFALCILVPVEARAALSYSLRLRPMEMIYRWTRYKGARGMSRWHDWIDWIGGYPFEVAKPEEIFDFCHVRGFELRKLKTSIAGACNEFVFQRVRKA